MAELQQIIPRPGEVRPYQITDERRWQRVIEEIYGSSAVPENIRFAHNPDWRQNVLSIQWTHDMVQQFFRSAAAPYVVTIEIAFTMATTTIWKIP